MLQTVFNWLRLDVQNLIKEVWWCVLILWVVLLIISLSDVAGYGISRGAKAAWMALIVLFPPVGLLAYCVFCLFRGDYSMLAFLFKRRKNPARPRIG